MEQSETLGRDGQCSQNEEAKASVGNSSAIEESTRHLGAEVVVVFFKQLMLLIEVGGNQDLHKRFRIYKNKVIGSSLVSIFKNTAILVRKVNQRMELLRAVWEFGFSMNEIGHL